MGKIKIIYILLITIVGHSCFTWMPMPDRIRKEFTYKFEDTYTGLDTLINIEGIFLPTKRTNYTGFYESRFFLSNGIVYINPAIGHIKKDFFATQHAEVGCYKLIKDTIKIQYISTPNSMTIGSIEEWFIIKNKRFIEKIYHGDVNPVLKTVPSISKYRDKFYKFKSQKIKYNYSKTWLLNKEWFWQTREEYKKWKKKRKNK